MEKTTDFHFFAEFVDKQVLDKDGAPAGSIHDIAFSLGGTYPKASALILKRGLLHRRYASVPWLRVERILATIQLGMTQDEIIFEPACPHHEFTVARDILDKQVVDTSGQKVIRVNDVRLLQIDSDIHLSQVDVGIRGIVRRVGWQWWVDPFFQTFLSRTEYLKDNLINWRYIQPLAIHPQKGTIQLAIPQKQLSMIPHADFSEMLMDLDIHKRLALFKSMSPDFRPRVFSDFSMEVQKEILENLDLKEAAELLSQVPADQTTDLLEELPKSITDSLLALMETSQARRLSALLGHTSDSAGGIMTTELLTCPATATVSDVVAHMRQLPDSPDIVTHVYLVTADNRLVGQVPLKKLLMAQASDPVARYSYPKPIYVRANDSLREVSFVMEKYKLPTIPVVNNGRERLLQGTITIDDILTRIIPLAWHRRTRRTTGAAS